ncbi:hypothetical protein B0H15DRAFT_931173 [Mycena belliarum]|uniref:F-box domain-containing protein n=1 Tax=Mycena belliarum TaxID=1033014 RepID=A0AAD6U7S9_9AGAR|nr:hypothetical protein B0H15DRAFT_931173 [Mycena belliae]
MEERVTKRQKAISVPLVDAVGAPPKENLFAEMPLDIILLFLLYTSPAELLALRDVNKGFRDLLDSGEQATAIWVKSREYHGIMKPLRGYTERAWARLIFGRICQECKVSEAREPDFGLMMRLCTWCRLINLCRETEYYYDDKNDFDYKFEGIPDDEEGIDSDEEPEEMYHNDTIPEFEDSFPHSDWYISRDKPSTHTDDTSSDDTSSDDTSPDDRTEDKYWWRPYLSEIIPVIRAARRGRKAAQKKLDMLNKKGWRRFEYGIICDNWRRQAEAEDRRHKAEILTKKFKTLGYRDFELDGLSGRIPLPRFDLPLTESAWGDIRRTLEGAIKDERRKRLLRDCPDIMKARAALAREVYAAYAATVAPPDAVYLPTVAGLDSIRTICERDSDVVVTYADFAHMPTIIVNWVGAKRAQLMKLVNKPTLDNTDAWALATTIFRCEISHGKLERPAMFGGDDAMRHVGELCDPRLDYHLSEVVSKLMRLLRLDSRTTTVADMDRHPARFRCVDYFCHMGIRESDQVYTWRGCVTHAIEGHLYGSSDMAYIYNTGTRNPTGRYYQVGDRDADFVRVSEIVEAQALRQLHDYPKAESTSWVCGHCTKYVCEPGTLQGVTDHVGAVHGKTQVDAADILLAPGVFSISRGSTYSALPLTAPEARSGSQGNSKPVEEFFCFKCVESKGFGDESCMTRHMQGKHKIRCPLRNVHYGLRAALSTPAVQTVALSIMEELFILEGNY